MSTFKAKKKSQTVSEKQNAKVRKRGAHRRELQLP